MMDTFTRAYLECALWTEDTDPGSGEWSEHDEWTIENLDPRWLAEAIADCADFQEANAELLAQAGTEERNGHDFWLTRNGHGAGFWDRGYGDVGGELSKAAKVYGSVDIVELIDDPRVDEDDEDNSLTDGE